MPVFSARSRRRLAVCDPRLQAVMNAVIEHVDCTVLEGHRNAERQAEMVRRGKSKLPWPRSKHNALPSLAVDALPYPIDWTDRERIARFAGYVQAVGDMHADGTWRIRWGGDWNRDFVSADERFFDGPHFELEDL